MNDGNSTSNPARLPLAERARLGLLLAEPELLVEELPLLEHPTDKAARLRFSYAVRAAMDYGDLAVVLKPVERMRYGLEIQRVRVSRDAPAQDTRRKIVCTETRRYFDREAYRAWRLTCPPDLLSPQSQIHKWLGAMPALSESIPPEISLAEKRQRQDALTHAIRAAIAVLSPAGGPLPQPRALFEYLATSDKTKTIVDSSKEQLTWYAAETGSKQTATIANLKRRLDRWID